ncbi:hypothetical protein CRUP_015271 [Coryphaenoides rupestris]|nr:hypothetical protein CRUP_015271 [Coryphaenoides rupestris]
MIVMAQIYFNCPRGVRLGLSLSLSLTLRNAASERIVDGAHRQPGWKITSGGGVWCATEGGLKQAYSTAGTDSKPASQPAREPPRARRSVQRHHHHHRHHHSSTDNDDERGKEKEEEKEEEEEGK